MAKNIYNIIKKQNGETFAKAIRNYDNGIFDIPNIDKIVKYAGHDARPIMSFLISLKDIRIQEQAVHMDPIELLDKAGYDAYIVNTLKEQNAIRKYFAPNERLCTFRDPNRFKEYYIINAVRKDVDTIKRSDFDNPERDDEYGTSVLSIQILKSGGFISIKNRYNHTVEQCDNTLNSNPDNIIVGLADAIRHYFGVNFSSRDEELPYDYIMIDNKIVKYVCEKNNVYCAEDFYVKDGIFYHIDKSSEIMLGNGLLLNLKEKTVNDVTDDALTMLTSLEDDFITSLNTAIYGKRLQVIKNPLGGHDIIANGTQILTIDCGKLVNINIPDAHTINIGNCYDMRGDLDFSNVTHLNLYNCDFSDVKSIKFNPCAISICLNRVQNLQLHGDLDFSGVNYLDLSNADMSNVTSIKLNSKAKEIKLPNTELKLRGCLDFSNVQTLSLRGVDLSEVTDIKFPRNAHIIDMAFVRNLKLKEPLVLNASFLIAIDVTDLSGIPEIIINPNCEEVSMECVTKLRGKIDFSGVKKLSLADTNVAKANITFNKSAESINLIQTKGLHGKLDFSDVATLSLEQANLSRATSVLFNPDAEQITIKDTKGLKGELDFSNVQSLSIKGADLSQVTKISLNPDGCIDDNIKTIQLHVGTVKIQSKAESQKRNAQTNLITHANKKTK